MSTPAEASTTFVLEPVDNERLANLCGHLDEHLALIEKRLGVSIGARGNLFSIEGDAAAVAVTQRVLKWLYQLSAKEVLNPAAVNLHLQESGLNDGDDAPADISIRTRRGLIRGRGPNQKNYLRRIRASDVNFGIGPAGTGKKIGRASCRERVVRAEGE